MILGHSEEKYTTGTCLSSSKKHDWQDLLAERWSHCAGKLSNIESHTTEIAILLEGKLKVQRRGDGQTQETTAVPGTIWLCPAGIPEEEVTLFGNIENCIHLYIPTDPISDTALQEFDLDPEPIRLNYDGGFHDPLIEQIGRAVMLEMDEETPGSRLLVDSLKTTLAVHLLKNYSNVPNNKINLAAVKGGLNQKRLGKINDYIIGHIDNNITLEELAAEACLSPFHFCRSFKKTTGVAPHKYVLNLRLNLSKKLISNGNLSLTQIAFMTGFPTQASFTRAFKRTLGCTPGQYRSELSR